MDSRMILIFWTVVWKEKVTETSYYNTKVQLPNCPIPQLPLFFIQCIKMFLFRLLKIMNKYFLNFMFSLSNEDRYRLAFELVVVPSPITFIIFNVRLSCFQIPSVGIWSYFILQHQIISQFSSHFCAIGFKKLLNF